jgi:hypothetical protein
MWGRFLRVVVLIDQWVRGLGGNLEEGNFQNCWHPLEWRGVAAFVGLCFLLSLFLFLMLSVSSFESVSTPPLQNASSGIPSSSV